jgi:hypothetical protein
VESSCACGNEPSGSIKCWKTIEWLHNSRVVLSSVQLDSIYIYIYVYNIIYVYCHLQLDLFPVAVLHKQ